MKKNIILFIVDALIPSRTGFGGNLAGLSPELNKLKDNSVYCKNAFSMGNPTEFALPGLFASSNLLDNGGYANGIANRETTLAEVLQREGYKTGCFLPIFRPLTNGYDRGFDDYYYLYESRVILKNFTNSSNWYSSMFDTGQIDKAECFTALESLFETYFSDIVEYCQYWQRELKESDVEESLIFKNTDYTYFEKQISIEHEKFRSNKDAYLHTFMKGENTGFADIIENVFKARMSKVRLTWVDIKYRLLMTMNLLLMWKSSTSYKSSKRILIGAINRILKGELFRVKYPSAGLILEKFKSWSNNIDRTSPFYAYVHIVDVHESSHYSFDLIGENEKKNIEMKLLREAFHEIRCDKNYSGNILYDCSIRYADYIIQQLREYLKSQNLLESTLIVITADHGGVYPNIPNREHMTHRVDCFYDELYHIPLIFSGSDIPSFEYNGLVSSLDIAPTILEMVGIKCPESFKGFPINDDNPVREHVTMENQGRGPCDLLRKPIRVCVRTNKMKLVYEAEPLLVSNNEYISELYDLDKDPNEFVNIARDESAINKAESLVKVAKSRIKAIRSIVTI